MKILIVNTYDKGGAANAALRLHKGLLDLGIDSKVLLKEKSKDIPETFEFKAFKKASKGEVFKRKLKSALYRIGLLPPKSKTERQKFLEERRKEGFELFSFPESNIDITESLLYKEADIINLHWVANFLDFESFFKKNTKPVVWTLHDMNPFTGGEHYEETIQSMDNLGNPVRRTFSKTHNDVKLKNLEKKELALQNVKNLHIISLCNWISKEIANNSIFKNLPLHLIPNGIDSNTFKIRDRIDSREYFKIPQEKIVILFVSDTINNHRKGYSFLKHAISNIKHRDLVCCAIGKKSSQDISDTDIVELGEIKDEIVMSKAYAMADVFVIPSLMDNLPNTVLESLLCGTPVIGFPVGGIIDMIEHGKNGLLTEAINSKTLRETIDHFLIDIYQFNREEISKNARKKYDIKIQSKAYANLFQSMVN